MTSPATNRKFPGHSLTHLRSRFTDEDALTLQARRFITGRHADISQKVGCHVSKISQYSNGTYHVPAFRLPAISAAQDNFEFAQLLFQQVGALLIPPRPTILHWSTLQMLATVVLKFGRFLTLAEKVQQDEPLEDEESIEFVETWNDLKRAGDALVARMLEQRTKKEQDKGE